MESAFFEFDAEVTLEVIATIIILAVFIERFLAMFFEWRVVLNLTHGKSFKEPVVFLVSIGIVYYYQFDALAILFQIHVNSIVGLILTAGVIAGFCKGATRLFRDVFGWKSAAQKVLDVQLGSFERKD